MELLAVGLSHRTATVALREKASLSPDAEAALLRDLVGHPAVAEAVALSTCNRVELYALVRSREEGVAELSSALVNASRIDLEELRRARYALSGAEAVHHLLRVAAGLDSMVLGESEIQGQVRRAIARAEELGSAGPELRELFRRALIAGKRVRRRTGIGRGPVSFAQVAVDVAARSLPDLSSRSVLIVGAGRAAEATARAFAARGVERIVCANRGPESAARVARVVGGVAAPLTVLRRELARADVVVCSTASPDVLIGVGDVEAALESRAGAPLVVIDVAVPRDVDRAVCGLPGVVLADIDDLKSVVRRNHDERRREAERAEWIVRAEAHRHLGRGRMPVAPAEYAA